MAIIPAAPAIIPSITDAAYIKPLVDDHIQGHGTEEHSHPVQHYIVTLKVSREENRSFSFTTSVSVRIVMPENRPYESLNITKGNAGIIFREENGPSRVDIVAQQVLEASRSLIEQEDRVRAREGLPAIQR